MLAWLFRERGEEAVDRILSVSAMSTVNLAEVLYQAAEHGMDVSDLPESLEAYGVTIAPFTAEDAALVREIRAEALRRRFRLSLADCCCLATGVRLNLPVVGGDQAWEALDLPVEVRPFR